MKIEKKIVAVVLSFAMVLGCIGIVPSVVKADSSNLLEIYDKDTPNSWYRDWPSGPDTENHYIELVEEGCKDDGAIHIVNTTAEADMRLSLNYNIPTGTYTIKMNVKGNVGVYNDNGNPLFYFYEPGKTMFQIPSQNSYADWTEVRGTINVTGGKYSSIRISKYVGATDFYIDNIRLLDADGKDVLDGIGHFCLNPNTEEKNPNLVEIYDSYTPNSWYRDWVGARDTENHYIELVDNGCNDDGALHIVNKITPEADMQVTLEHGIPAGTYTVMMNVKGTVGYVKEPMLRFQEAGHYDDAFQIANQNNYGNWTQVIGQITTYGGRYYAIYISTYAWATDFYIDNIQILDANGKDMLDGMGNFCIKSAEEPGDNSDLLPIYDSYTPAGWYRDWMASGEFDGHDTEAHYMEIVRNGCNDVGALHVVNTAPEVDMRLSIERSIPAGEYTIKMNVKGNVGVYNDRGTPLLYFYESGNHGSISQIPNENSYAGWTEVSGTITLAGGKYFSVCVNKWVGVTDFYIDNIQILDTNGKDMLDGIGNFCVKSAIKDPELLTLYEEFTINNWYRDWTYGRDNGTHYLELVPEGCADKGSLHFVNTTPEGDLMVAIYCNVPAGTYTLKMNVKGSVGYDDPQYFKFLEQGHEETAFSINDGIRYKDWTELSGTFVGNGGSIYLIRFSQYNWKTDFYIDNIRLIDADGNDVLGGKGNFCTNPQMQIDTTEKIMVTSVGGDAQGLDLTIPAGKLIGTLSGIEGGIYINGTLSEDILAKVTPAGALRLAYSASEGDVVALDGILADNYYGKQVSSVAFRYYNGNWESMLGVENAEFYFPETIIKNHVFDSDISGWKLNSSSGKDTISYSADGYEGGAILVTHYGSEGDLTYGVGTTEDIPVIPGSTYHVRLYVKATGNMKLGCSLLGNGSEMVADAVECCAIISSGTDGWQQMNYTFTIPSDVSAVKLQLDHEFYATDAAVRYDNISFYREYPLGDVNGDDEQTVADIIRYKKVFAKTANVSFQSKNAADFNASHDINIVDLVDYAYYLLGGTGEGSRIPYVYVTSPQGVVYSYNDTAKAYLTVKGANVGDYATEKIFDSAQDVIITYECAVPNATFKVEYGTKSDYSDVITVMTEDTYIAVNNLYKDSVYYVRVTATANGYIQMTESTFQTTDIGPRVMTVNNVFNVRDIGGYETSFGKKTMQGLVYRGSQSDKYLGITLLTPEGQNTMSNILGIKLDMDLREADSLKSPIDTAAYHNYQILAYAGAFKAEQKDLYHDIFADFADVNNYPIYFHCIWGADRTGTVAYLLNALLGVSEEDLLRDYEYTSFSQTGLREAGNVEMKELREQLNAFPGDTLAEKTENYMYSIGITKDQINAIRGIMFGEIPIN